VKDGFVVVKQQSHVGEEYVDSLTSAGITAFLCKPAML